VSDLRRTPSPVDFFRFQSAASALEKAAIQKTDPSRPLPQGIYMLPYIYNSWRNFRTNFSIAGNLYHRISTIKDYDMFFLRKRWESKMTEAEKME